MRKLAVLLLATLVFGGLLVVESSDPAGAQDKPGDVRADDTPLPAFDESGELPEELRDPSFDRYVNVRQLGEAFEDNNALLAAEVAIQLAEGERVLLRSHKAIKAKDALRLAIKLAIDQREKEALQRLSDYAKGSGNAGLTQQLSQAQALAGAKRAIDPLFQGAADSMPLEQFGTLQRVARELEAAKLLGDISVLTELIEEFNGPGGARLPSDRKEPVLKRLEDTVKQLKGSATDPLKGTLDKLRMATRTMHPAIGSGITYFIVSKYTGKVLDVPNGVFVNGGAVNQYGYHGGRNQQWQLEGPVAGRYYIRNVASGGYLAAPSPGRYSANLAQATRSDPNHGVTWFTGDPGDGSLHIRWSSYYSLDVPGGVSYPVRLQIYQHHGGPNQRWYFDTSATVRSHTR